MGDARLARIAPLDAANAEEFFAAALEVGFDGFDVGRGYHKNHPTPMLGSSNSLVSIFPRSARNLKM